MTKKDLPAFELTDAFFTSLEFRRVPEMPQPLNLSFNVQLKVHDERLPEILQIDLKLATFEDQPLTMILELVGLFKRPEDQAQPGTDELSHFINERALVALWPYIVQMSKLVTSQMGIAPVKIRTPHAFQFAPEASEGQ